MRPHQHPTSPRARRKGGLAFCGLLALQLLCMASGPAFAQKAADVIKDAQTAVKEVKDAQATRAAEAPKLGRTVQAKEDDLEKAVREKEDIDGNPTSTQAQKDAAKDKVDAAKEKADEVAETFGKKTTKYREAQKKERDGLNKLRKLQGRLAEIAGNRRKAGLIDRDNEFEALLGEVNKFVSDRKAADRGIRLLSRGWADLFFASEPLFFERLRHNDSGNGGGNGDGGGGEGGGGAR